mgnify:CR=1 FL=1
MILIKNARLKTIANGDIESGCVLLGDDGKIAAVGQNIEAPEGAEVIDLGGRRKPPKMIR